MIDIHPAHHAASTWRDFFIHIATIVLGLLIAVGLEQAVELVHRHREARETRENLKQEIADNIAITQRDLRQLAAFQKKLDLDYDLLNGAVPDAQSLPRLDYDFNFTKRHDAAWSAAKINGSLALIPSSEIRSVNYYYETANDFEPALREFFVQTYTGEAVVVHARAAGRLTASDRQQLLSLTASAMGSEQLISRIYSNEVSALEASELQ